MGDAEFWLKVARAMGLDVREHVDGLRRHQGDWEWEWWHPPTNPAQAWEMHDWVTTKGLAVLCRPVNDELMRASIYEPDAITSIAVGEGLTFRVALGAAILEMVG